MCFMIGLLEDLRGRIDLLVNHPNSTVAAQAAELEDLVDRIEDR